MNHMMNHLTDAQLVQALRNEKAGAIEETYRRYGDDILAYTERHAKPVAEDIQQQVFLHLTMHGSEVTTSVRGWLFTAARTTIAQWKRARKNFPEPIPAHQTETNSAFEIIDRCDDIDHLLDRLTPARSAALRAIYLDGLTYEEAAIKLGITEKALDDRLLWAKRQLRQLREKVA